MFHPISPGLSGTDGKTNLSENAATRPVQMHENTSEGCAVRSEGAAVDQAVFAIQLSILIE